MSEIKLALVSVSDKSGLETLGDLLLKKGYTILSTGGTAKKLRECLDDKANRVMDVSEYTGYPESPEGLVKTLHPKIHAGLLMNPNNSQHAQYMAKIGAFPINFVAVNLYPFAKTIAEDDVTLTEASEQIDIGGPTMLRAAAKGLLLNRRPLVVCNPEDYATTVNMLDDIDGIGSAIFRPMAAKVFAHTAAYEKTIDEYLKKVA